MPARLNVLLLLWAALLLADVHGKGIQITDAVKANRGRQADEISSNLEPILLKNASNEDPRRKLQSTVPVSALTTRVSLSLFVEPSNNTFSPTALSVFVRASNPLAEIRYTLDGSPPTLRSPRATYDAPYIQVDTPFGAARRRVLRAIAVMLEVDSEYSISTETENVYFVEATDRPGSFGFLVPGKETSGYFVRMGIEMSAAARAQLAGGQEFADFATELGIGPYSDQLRLLHLPSIDPDLGGFEGGFPANTNGKHYGYIVPHHNGQKFFGKVVRIDLPRMENTALCAASVRRQHKDRNSGLIVTSGASNNEACVTILDLESLHERAVGFMKGFTGVINGRTYAFLSPGQFDVAVRLDLEDFSLETTRIIALGDFKRFMGGYSGGFVDAPWACFSPFRSYVGPVGGVRSNLSVDLFHLRPYHHSVFVCINHTAWTDNSQFEKTIRTFDLGEVESSLRGFSETIRVGRYIYLSPFASNVNAYSSKLIRISCGDNNIIETIDANAAAGGNLRDLILALDLTQRDAGLVGFSGIFNAGKYLYLCPYRGEHEPRNGQRGHGRVPRIDMNIFDIEGVDVIDLPTSIRSQIPSFPENNLRGFSGCFASGKYGIFVPFYNGIFYGKVGRIDILKWENIQQVDLVIDRHTPELLKAFRGGFVNLWQGWFPVDDEEQ